MSTALLFIGVVVGVLFSYSLLSGIEVAVTNILVPVLLGLLIVRFNVLKITEWLVAVFVIIKGVILLKNGQTEAVFVTYFFIALILLLPISFIKRRTIVNILIVLILGGIVLLGINRTQSLNRLQVRADSWNAHFHLVEYYPLSGVGLDGRIHHLQNDLVVPYMIFDHAVDGPYSLPIQLWLNLGIVGVLSWLGYLLEIIAMPQWNRWQLICLLISFFGLILYPLLQGGVEFIFWLSIIMGTFKYSREKK